MPCHSEVGGLQESGPYIIYLTDIPYESIDHGHHVYAIMYRVGLGFGIGLRIAVHNYLGRRQHQL